MERKVPSSDEVLGNFRSFDFLNFQKQILYSQKILYFQRKSNVLHGHFFIEKIFSLVYTDSTL